MEKKKINHSGMLLLAGLLVANVILAGLLLQGMKEKKSLEAQFADSGEASESITEAIDITLPEIIYAAEGMTMEIYNAQVTSLGSDITKYNVLWNCETGENLERKYSVTAGEENIGSYELKLEIYNNDLELLAQKDCVLKVVKGNEQHRETANAVKEISEVPAECLQQVNCCVDTAYFGTLEELKAEGVAQMQDIVYSVLSGIE